MPSSTRAHIHDVGSPGRSVWTGIPGPVFPPSARSAQRVSLGSNSDPPQLGARPLGPVMLAASTSAPAMEDEDAPVVHVNLTPMTLVSRSLNASFSGWDGGSDSPRPVRSAAGLPAMMADLLLASDDHDDCVVFGQKDLPSHAFPVMEDIRRQGKLCDVTLQIEDNRFHAHRIVLAGAIPYFHAMFTHDMMESTQREITIQGVEANAMEAMINFAYSGKVSISTSNVQNLMMAASFLQLSRVRDACAEFLMTRLSPVNVLGVQQFADTLGCSSLVTATEKYVQKFFTHVIENEEFQTFGFRQVFDLVSHDELHIQSEEVVFDAILKWVRYDVGHRQAHLPQLLTCVRLPLLTPQFLSDTVAAEELVRSSHKCRDLLDEARDYHLMPERRPLLQSFKTKPRRCKEIIGVIYAVGGQTKSGNSLSTVEMYEPVVGRWRDAEAMSMLRSRVGVAVMRNRLYAIGGYNGTDRLNTVEVFDAKTKRWSKIAAMNCKRSAVGAVALEDALYVCGGFDGLSSSDTVEKYEPGAKTWTMVATMTKHRSAAGVVSLYGKIYALGGHNGLSIFESVECYDPKANVWTEVVPMLSKRCRLGVATLGGRIYACGGYDGSSFLKSVEMFDPVANRWTYVSPMNVTRSRVALVSNMDRLWAIGGYDGMKNLSTVEMYNPDTDEWSFVSSMESHEGGVGVGVIPLENEHLHDLNLTFPVKEAHWSRKQRRESRNQASLNDDGDPFVGTGDTSRHS